MDGTFNKIRLAEGLPKGPGIYRFLGASGQTLYVGKATDLRSRVRSYFYGDPRRKMRDLLRETQDVKVEQHATMLEAEVAEARAIARETPPYNRAGKRTGTWYLKLTIRGRNPKVSPSRTPKDDGGIYLGPFHSMRSVRVLQDAVRDGLSIHRCTEPARCKGCAFADLGTCEGSVRRSHKRELHRLASATVHDPTLVLEGIRARMTRLAEQQRFEEATEVRERGARLQRSLERMIQCHSLLDAGDLVIGIEERAMLLRRGRLVAATFIASGDVWSAIERLRSDAVEPGGSNTCAEARREIGAISSWIARNASEVRLLHVSGSWVSPARSGPRDLFAARG
jgi:DNA polymerase-3 subunit epsilon